MKPAPFEYASPATLEEATSILQQAEDSGTEATILAGGQSLMPMLNMRLARPDLLVDLRQVANLNFIEQDDDALLIGAMTTKRDVEDSDLVKQVHPMLHQATLLIGHRQIRSRGTVGGSLAQADPAAEYPALALACGAQLGVLGPEGERVIPADEFFVTYLTTALEPNEILVAFRIPILGANTGWSFQEITRRHGDFAMAGSAITLTVENGTCTAARIVIFAVDAVPLRVEAAEALVIGQAPTEAVFQLASEAVEKAIDAPMSDVHASGEYRRHLAGVLTRRGLAEALNRASAITST